MKTGYSILLGETVEAQAVQYRDCERFQIVCPHCREPVFKVRRSSSTQSDLHYLAHYSAGASYQGECDLRVAQMDRVEQEKCNHQSRDQRLAYFLGVLRRTLAMDPIYADSAEKSHWRMDHAPGIVRIRDLTWEGITLDREEFFDECAIDYLYRLDDSGWALTTSFSLDRQRQIARDMWMTITSSTGHSNFNYLFNHGLMREIGNMGNIRNDDRYGIEIANHMMDYIQALTAVRKSAIDRILQRMVAHELPRGFSKVRGVETGEKSSYFTRLLGNISLEMIGTLVAFPYFELLKQQYGESSKIYPYQPGVQPVDPEEIQRVKLLRETATRNRNARPAS